MLIKSNTHALHWTLMLGLTTVVLMIAAVSLPYLSIEAEGLRNRTSVLDAILSFADGLLLPLTVIVAAVIVAIPLIRVVLLAYVVSPLIAGRAPRAHAGTAFRWSEALRPWSMAEIFTIGVAVALVKVSDLADVLPGPAFWFFGLLVVLVVLQDSFMCRWSIWKSLDKTRPS